MPKHNFMPLAGRLETLWIESPALADNLLGDPGGRSVAVYLPPRAIRGEKLPLLVDIAGFTGSGLSHIGWKAFAETVPQRVERLVAADAMDEVIVAFPDCFTSLGGNQYINSVAMGRWADFLVDDMVPRLEATFPILPGAAHRGLFGKSSGGYGALAHGMRHGSAWGAIACHSGDVEFDLCYRGDLPGVVTTLAGYGGNIRAFVDKLWGAKRIHGGEMHTLMILAMAATYDPAPDEPYGIRLPVSLDTCELIESRWQNWLDADPLHMIETPAAQASMAALRGIYIDCGERDQYHLLYGARRLSRRLESLGISHRYEEFADTHSGVDYRMDESLPYLAGVLSASA